jgi:PAS domain S-box-containing protein
MSSRAPDVGHERNQSQAAFSPSYLAAILESSHDALISITLEGAITSWNPAAETLYGYGAAAILGKPIAILVPPELQDDLGHMMQRLKAGDTITHHETTRLRKDGTRVVVSVTVSPMKDASGTIVGASTIARDLTALKQAEEGERAERGIQQTLQSLLLMADSLVLVPRDKASAEEQVSSVARELAQRMATLACTVLGCTRASIVTLDPPSQQVQSLAVIGLSDEQEQQWWADTLTSYVREHLGDRRLASWLQVGGVLLLDAPRSGLRDRLQSCDLGMILSLPLYVGNHLIGLLSLDHGGEEHCYTLQEIVLAEAVAILVAIVLERGGLLQEQVDARARELAQQEATRRMDTFLAIACHELRTPLTSIMGNIELMALLLQRMAQERRAPVNNEQANRYSALLGPLGSAERQVHALARLVNDLVDVSRIQANKLEMRMEVCDLAALVREVVQEQRQVAPTRTISLDVPQEREVQVMADAGRLGQVLTNYLTNALKYSPADRPVGVCLRGEGQNARVLVRDQGPGLSASQQTPIWERFHQVPGITVQSGSSVGLGLGLHISWTIIESHHGQVGVDSSPGEGSTFWFTLPLASAADRKS